MWNLRIGGFGDWEIGELLIGGLGDRDPRVEEMRGTDLTQLQLEEMFSVISVGNCKLAI